MIQIVTVAAAIVAGLADAPLRGTVLSDAGGPIAGAKVLLTGTASPMGSHPIVARGMTDDRGRFTLERAGSFGDLPGDIARLWVAAPGHRLASLDYRGGLPRADESVRMVLGPPGRAEFRIRKPDGSPAAGARVRVTRTKGSGFVEIPDELRDLASATADAEGYAVVDAVAPRDVTHFEVEADGFGVQPRDEFPPTSGVKAIKLRAVGRLEGRLVAEGAFDFKGWRLTAATRPDDPGGPPWPTGRGTSVVGPDGRYSIPEIAEGRLSFRIEWPDESPVLPEFAKAAPSVVAGRVNLSDIPLRPATVVFGTVRGRAGDDPVEGAKLYFFRPGEDSSTPIVTDARGRFEVRSLGGKAKLWLSDVPETHVAIPGFRDDDLVIPPGPARFEINAISVRRAAVPLRGTVRDEAGRPARRAIVQYVWNEQNEGGSYRTNGSAMTDAAGAFSLGGMAPGAEVLVSARLGERITAGSVTGRAGQAEPLSLRIDPSETIAVSGRVLGPKGVPVAGAGVKLTAQVMKNGRAGDFRQIRFDEMGAELITGADGSFRSPKELNRRDAMFRAEIVAPGYESAQTAWVAAGEGAVVAMPDVKLVRSLAPREVTGRVEGSDRRPLSGARIFQLGNGARRTGATAGADGVFRLAGVPDGTALVFAEAAGFRLAGAIVADEGGDVVIRLSREDAPAPAREEARPAMSRAEERLLARKLLAAHLPRAEGGIAHVDDPLTILARVDPDRVLAMIEDRIVTNPGPSMIATALGRFEDDPAAAVATIEADQEPKSRAAGFLALAAMVPRAEAARCGPYLERALTEARRVVEVDTRLLLLGQVAAAWLAIGDAARARPILVEGKGLLATLSIDRYSFRAEEFGEVLGVIDLAAARDLFDRKGMKNVTPTDATQVDRHLGNLAVRLAPFDPASAEQIARGLRVAPVYSTDRSVFILRTCRAMAAADLPRARRLLDALDDAARPERSSPTIFKPYGLGRMAEAIRESNPAAARSLLDEAYATLRAASDQAQGGPTYPPVACVMAGFLPTVAKVDPARLRERAWLAASCRTLQPSSPAPSMNAFRERAILEEDAAVALFVAPHDRRLADAIAAPIFERLPGLAGDPDSLYNDGVRLFRAVATLDPARIEPLLSGLPEVARTAKKEANGWTRNCLDTWARLAAAEILGLPPEARPRAALRNGARDWPIDGPE